MLLGNATDGREKNHIVGLEFLKQQTHADTPMAYFFSAIWLLTIFLLQGSVHYALHTNIFIHKFDKM